MQTLAGNLIQLFRFCGLFPFLEFIFQDILFSCDKFSFGYSSYLADLMNLSMSLILCFIFCHDIRSPSVIIETFNLYFLFILKIILVASSTTNCNYYYFLKNK